MRFLPGVCKEEPVTIGEKNNIVPVHVPCPGRIMVVHTTAIIIVLSHILIDISINVIVILIQSLVGVSQIRGTLFRGPHKKD